MLVTCLSAVLGAVLVDAGVPPTPTTQSGYQAGTAEALAWRLPQLRDEAVRQRCDRVYQACERLARCQISQIHPWTEDLVLSLTTDSKSTENFIRPNTGTVEGLAFLCRFGPYDDKRVGLSRTELLQTKIIPMMRYLTTTHVTGSQSTSDGKRWGNAWQSAHWTSALGRAGWWLEADLPEDLVSGVRRVVAHEADRIAAGSPPHQIEKDTKAEENAWNSQVLSVAVVLMPADSRRAMWEKAFQRWVLSSFLRSTDAAATHVVDGRPVSEQFTGANIYDDFTLENHRIVHPDYMTAFNLSLGCTLDYAMTDRHPPEALLYNIPGIYENLKWFTLVDGGFVYPSGQDWGLFRNPDWVYPHLLMAVFGRDPEAWPLTDQALDTFERMQARNVSGAVYLPEENFFASAHADKLYQLAHCWLALHFSDRIAAAPPPQRKGIRRLDSGKIILNRTSSAIHTFSWGARVMAQCVPQRMDRVVSPHERSGIGHIVLDGKTKPLPVTLREVKVTNAAGSFDAEVTVAHGEVVTAYLRYRSESDSTWIMREKLVASTGFDSKEIATGLIGILNNRRWIHERGQRAVALDGKQTTISACSGQEIGRDGARRIDIDGVLQIVSPRPLAVVYRAASEPVRGRATDELYLNHVPGKHHFEAGDVICEWEATVRCVPNQGPFSQPAPLEGSNRTD